MNVWFKLVEIWTHITKPSLFTILTLADTVDCATIQDHSCISLTVSVQCTLLITSHWYYRSASQSAILELPSSSRCHRNEGLLSDLSLHNNWLQTYRLPTTSTERFNRPRSENWYHNSLTNSCENQNQMDGLCLAASYDQLLSSDSWI